MGHRALTRRLTLGNRWPQVKAFFYGRFMNYYSHHIGDFDRATRHLTRIERSVYLDLMFTYYDTEQPLTADIAALCRKIVARTEEEKSAVLAILDEFFVTTPNGWFHDRCEEELAKFRETKSQASAAGKASAMKRAERRQAAINGNPTDVERRANGNPTTVERPLSERSTDVQRSLNRSSTNQEPRSNTQEPETKTQPATEHSSQALAVKPSDLSIAFRSQGIMTQPADPRLIELASQGVQVETVTAACAEAKAAKPGESIGLGYVLAILKRWAADAAKVKVQGAAAPNARASPDRPTSRHNGFEAIDYNEGIENGRIT